MIVENTSSIHTPVTNCNLASWDGSFPFSDSGKFSPLTVEVKATGTATNLNYARPFPYQRAFSQTSTLSACTSSRFPDAFATHPERGADRLPFETHQESSVFAFVISTEQRLLRTREIKSISTKEVGQNTEKMILLELCCFARRTVAFAFSLSFPNCLVRPNLVFFAM